MERLNFELSFDADLNVKRPIAASACWVSRRAIGEYSSKRSILNASDSATAPGWNRGSYSITFNISHCANVQIPKSQQDAEVNGREA